MPDEMLGERGTVAFGQTVASNPALLDVSGRDREHVAFPRARGKALPGVHRVLRWMWAAVHPDRPGLFVRADVVLDCHELLRFGILLLPDAQLQRAAIDVRRDMHLTLMLFKCQA